MISDYSDKLYTLPSKKMTTSCKSWGDQIHLVPVISKVGGDASHGPLRVDVPMSIFVFSPDQSLWGACDPGDEIFVQIE